MYKLIIVDDEEEVRKGIIEKLDWNGLGFRVIGEAENGIDALEVIEKDVPDVVITDIKMPYMDGLSLAQKIKYRFPTIQIIILTGFDEFEYAQKAIKLDVIEYVLKPVCSKDLIDILIKVKSKIDNQIAQKKDLEILKEYYKKSLPILREKFLCTIITTRLNKDEIVEKANEYDLHINGSGFFASIINIDFNYITEITGFHMPEDKELIKFAVFNIGNEIVEKHDIGTIFLYNNDIVIIFEDEDNNLQVFKTKIFNTLEEIRQSIKKYIGFSITIGIGSFCEDISDISRSYENASAALDYKLILGGNRLIYIEDMEPQCAKKVIFDELKERSLTNSIKVGTKEEIEQVIKKLLQEIVDVQTFFKDYQIYLLEILTTILKVAKNLGVDLDDLFGRNYNLFAEIYKFDDIDEVERWLINICVKIKSYIFMERHDTCKLLIQKATQYIQKNYYDDSLTIDKVCNYLHISSTYFSTIFKKETKLTFVNYLTNVRMEAAKNLLRTTDMKSYQISEKVGFSEPNYFSYCFKKNVGVSPSKYRKSI